MSANVWQRTSFRVIVWMAILALLAGLSLWSEMPFQEARAAGDEQSGLPRVLLVEVARGLDWPVHVTHAGDGSGRLFVVEQAGRVRIIKDGVLLDRAFLDIPPR